MNDPRREKFGSYIRDLANLMDLRDWTLIIIHEDPPNRSNIASVYIPLGQRFCNIYLSTNFLTETPENQRSTIVHELTHCHFDAARKAARLSLSKKQYKIWNITFESGIDATAVAWAKTLPLPEFPDEKKKKKKK